MRQMCPSKKNDEASDDTGGWWKRCSGSMLFYFARFVFLKAPFSFANEKLANIDDKSSSNKTSSAKNVIIINRIFKEKLDKYRWQDELERPRRWQTTTRWTNNNDASLDKLLKRNQICKFAKHRWLDKLGFKKNKMKIKLMNWTSWQKRSMQKWTQTKSTWWAEQLEGPEKLLKREPIKRKTNVGETSTAKEAQSTNRWQESWDCSLGEPSEPSLERQTMTDDDPTNGQQRLIVGQAHEKKQKCLLDKHWWLDKRRCRKKKNSSTAQAD